MQAGSHSPIRQLAPVAGCNTPFAGGREVLQYKKGWFWAVTLPVLLVFVVRLPPLLQLAGSAEAGAEGGAGAMMMPWSLHLSHQWFSCSIKPLLRSLSRLQSRWEF
jgi:hypothetical protein